MVQITKRFKELELVQQQHFILIHYRMLTVDHIHGHISVQCLLVGCQMISTPSCTVNQLERSIRT